MRGLPQRLDRDRLQRRLRRAGDIAGGQQPAGQLLERIQPELPNRSRSSRTQSSYQPSSRSSQASTRTAVAGRRPGRRRARPGRRRGHRARRPRRSGRRASTPPVEQVSGPARFRRCSRDSVARRLPCACASEHSGQSVPARYGRSHRPRRASRANIRRPLTPISRTSPEAVSRQVPSRSRRHVVAPVASPMSLVSIIPAIGAPTSSPVGRDRHTIAGCRPSAVAAPSPAAPTHSFPGYRVAARDGKVNAFHPRPCSAGS